MFIHKISTDRQTQRQIYQQYRRSSQMDRPKIRLTKRNRHKNTSWIDGNRKKSRQIYQQSNKPEETGSHANSLRRAWSVLALCVPSGLAAGWVHRGARGNCTLNDSLRRAAPSEHGHGKHERKRKLRTELHLCSGGLMGRKASQRWLFRVSKLYGLCGRSAWGTVCCSNLCITFTFYFLILLLSFFFVWRRKKRGWC